MDVLWFKQQQKRAGVTSEDIAQIRGRDRSIVSHIYAGRQKMDLDWARAFSEALELPLATILQRAGVTDEAEGQQLAPGFAESDAAPWTGKPAEKARTDDRARLFGGARPGIDVWTVTSKALLFQGLLPGDQILVDTHQSERCKAGDVVIAQIYEHNKSTATTVLRRYEPPALVAAGPDPEDQRIHIVDHNNVAIRGKVIASWRES